MNAYLHIESMHAYCLHLLIQCVHSTESTKILGILIHKGISNFLLNVHKQVVSGWM